jgi:hypothetical protein
MRLVDPVRSDAIREALEHGRDGCADAVRQARERARDVSRVLGRTASALEHSARLAAAHADRQQRAGREDSASAERLAAVRAGQAADRARAHAAAFGALAAGGAAPDPSPRSLTGSPDHRLR